MSNRQWDDLAKNYTLYQYSDGKSSREIHNALVRMGYNTLSINIVERHIEAHDGEGVTWMPIQGIQRTPSPQDRRAVDSPTTKSPATTDSPAISSTVAIHSAAGQASRPNGETGQAQSQASPVVAPSIPWDILAGRFTISAHRMGQSVPQILARLRQNGYNVTVVEVVASLNL